MLVQPDDRKKPDSRRVFAIFHNKVALGGGQSAEKTSPDARVIIAPHKSVEVSRLGFEVLGLGFEVSRLGPS